MEVIINTENSCRTCLQSAFDLRNIFDIYDGRLISEILVELCGITIDENDRLSKKICGKCVEKLLELQVFRQMCVDSDDTVRYNLLLAEEEVPEMITVDALKTGVDMSQLEEYFIVDDGTVSVEQFFAERRRRRI